MLRSLSLAIALAWLPAAQAALPQPVSQLMAEARIPEDAIGVLVLRGDATVVSHMPERALQPASTMKLVTTLVGLEQLGPVFRGRTDILTNGLLVDEVLRGDLIVRGGADVDFNGEVLTNMLQALRNQGIRRIEGRLVLDRQLFNPARTDVGIAPFDEYPDSYYNVIPDALLVNKNMLLLDMRSDGQRLKLASQPQLDRVSVESAMTLIDGDCAKWEDGWKYPEIERGRGGRIRVVLQGTFPKNCVKSNSINVLDRHDYLDRLVRITWSKLGGSLHGETVDGITPPGARLLAEHVSRALPEVVRDINKPSDNALARTLFLSLGSLEPDLVQGSRPLAPMAGQTTFMRADQAIRSWMQRQGIDPAGLVMDNGSGLSRIEKISPYQMAMLLQAGLRSNWAPEFLASLPIVAVDGTMRRRLKDSPAAQRARLKTGTLKNVTALAGYVVDAKGQQCVVVAMINHELAGEGKARLVLDGLVDWVARSGN